ncbi:MAG: preprotein translocase subunit SecG [Bacilli bacterium]|nr:preprotein translocase subunit SecG [Bacilli bacterium]
MDTVLLIVSILLIAIVLLQSGKAESASQIIQGGNSELFSNRKERGAELFISRLTMILGSLFFIICLISSFKK